MTAVLAACSFVNSAPAQYQVPRINRGPLARLVHTPGHPAGLPPYALADQSGAIHRYVEPVPGIDLESHVGSIVTVRHDTGETLLASQLELPQSSLYPMIGETNTPAHSPGSRFSHLVMGSAKPDRMIHQAEFVDNDDSTVELIEEGQTPPTGAMMVSPEQLPSGAMPQGAIYPDGTPAYPGPMMAGPMGTAPMYVDPSMAGYPGDPTMQQFGAFPGAPFDPTGGFIQPFGQSSSQGMQDRAHIYGEVEINFLRAHIMENSFGKLSEKYEFSPRFIIGFTDVANLSGRVRYWIYGRGTNGLDPDDSVHIDFDVWDLEATHRFVGKKTEVELAAGVRFAKIEIHDSEGYASGTDLCGLTMAADGWTPIFDCNQGCFGWVYGGRLSILAGDWGGDENSDIINQRVQDDNVLVNELYVGLGFTRRCRSLDMNARIGFEMQNWHSDALAEAGLGDSIGFIGPGVEIGAQF